MFGGIPFEQHFGAGKPPTMNENVDTSKLYETLEVEKDATSKEIRKAYFRLSKVHHPDKGGDEHKFKEINAAYNILIDPEKRAAYDKYGLDGVSDENNQDGFGGSPEDLYSRFFGRGRADRGPRKSPSIQHPLRVTLEQLYNGKTSKMAINRKIVVGEASECIDCHGQGVTTEMRQLGPGMVTQMQRTCATCQGQGKIAETKTKREVVEVHIEKGMSHGDKITFRGMSDEVPGVEETGDVHFVIDEQPHKLFKRKGADLLVTRDISLNQALTGFTWKFQHLDGRDIRVMTKPGEIIPSESKNPVTGRTLPHVSVVPNEGMPSRGNPFVKGNLYILFHVRFPKSLPADVIDQIRKLLPDPDEHDFAGDDGDAEMSPSNDGALDTEEYYMETGDVHQFGKGGASSPTSSEYDSDEEGAGGAPIQCQQS